MLNLFLRAFVILYKQANQLRVVVMSDEGRIRGGHLCMPWHKERLKCSLQCQQPYRSKRFSPSHFYPHWSQISIHWQQKYKEQICRNSSPVFHLKLVNIHRGFDIKYRCLIEPILTVLFFCYWTWKILSL